MKQHLTISQVEQIKEELPHGSGIDAKWEVDILRNGNIVFSNSFHNMDESGFYNGWTDFRVIIFKYKEDILNPLRGPSEGKTQVCWRKGDLDFKIVGQFSRAHDGASLCEYLYDVFGGFFSELAKNTDIKIGQLRMEII